MPFEVIECPKCGASASSGPTPDGSYTCPYCKTRFRARQTAAIPKAQPPPQPGARPPRVLSAAERKKALTSFVSVVVLVVVAIGIRLALTKSTARASDASSNGFVPPVPAEPPIPATGTFEFQNRIPAYETSFYVLGYVTNTSPFVVDRPKVTAVLHGPNGAEAGSADGFAEGDTLGPGEKAPAKILVQTPPAFDTITYEVVVARSSFHTPVAEGLRVDILQPPHEVTGTWEVSGKIHNGGTNAARFINVRVLAFDAANHLVGLDTTFADGQSVPAGTDARFRLTPLYEKAPARFEYSVSAQRLN